MGCPQSWLSGQGEGQVAVTCWEETNVKRRAFWGAEVSLPCSAQYGGTCGPFHLGSLSHHLGPPLSSYVTCKVGAENPSVSVPPVTCHRHSFEVSGTVG